MLWVKTFHIVAVMAWMAGIFYLPRIFVHYVEGRAAGEDVRRLLIMARRLFGFMSLLAIIAIALGLWMWLGYGDGGRWLHIKLVFVVGLIIYHAVCHQLLLRMRNDRPLPSGLALRLLNESALLLLVPIVALAVFKP